MILLEIEDHCTGIKSIVEARDTMHAHDVLTDFGFKFLLKGLPSDYYADDCLWGKHLDGEEISAMIYHTQSMNIDHIPKNFDEVIRNKRANHKQEQK
jgi:hypothetical protein